jgi:hypothetical protein
MNTSSPDFDSKLNEWLKGFVAQDGMDAADTRLGALQSRFKKPKCDPTLASPKHVTLGWPRWMDLETASEYCSHSVDLLREAIANKELPAVLKGKGEQRCHYILDMFDIDEWLERKKK